MSKVVLDVSMSLDGFTTGPNVRDVVLGADVARQLLRAALLDEVRIAIVPLLMGAGTRLFAGERAELIPAGKPVTGAVTHLRYRVARP
jgi:dihydrofolate reductase